MKLLQSYIANNADISAINFKFHELTVWHFLFSQFWNKTNRNQCETTSYLSCFHLYIYIVILYFISFRYVIC